MEAYYIAERRIVHSSGTLERTDTVSIAVTEASVITTAKLVIVTHDKSPRTPPRGYLFVLRFGNAWGIRTRDLRLECGGRVIM